MYTHTHIPPPPPPPPQTPTIKSHPHHSQSPGAGGQLSFGTVAPRQGEAPGGRVSAKEQAYVQVVKRLNAAAAQRQGVDAVAEFGAACAANEDRPGGAGGGGA